MAVSSTSYTKTPQAGADFLGSSEDYFDNNDILTLDVMSNDLGGNAKTLFSVDDGSALSDLLGKDTSSYTEEQAGLGWEPTSNGNWIRINNGMIEFKLNADFDVNTLGEGDTVTDTFKYAIQLGNGTISYATVSVTLTGTNDQPVLTITDVTGAMNEGDGTAELSDTGSLSFSDVDIGDVVTVSQTSNGDIAWSGGDLSDALKTSLVNGFSVDQDSWDYSTSENLDFLGKDETITMTFNVVATDDSSAANAVSASKTVTITITGTNDQPTLTIADVTGAMNEGESTAELSDSGALSFNDVDHGDVVTVSQTSNGDIAWSGGDLSDALKTSLVNGFSVDQDSWDYSTSENLDFLGKDETITMTFNVVATDDSSAANAVSASKTVTITITGTNDVASITGDISRSVTEDSGTYLVSGDLDVVDLDHDESGFKTVASTDLVGTYGDFTFDETTGAWTYMLDNSKAQALDADDHPEEILTVESLDGTTQTITVTVNGVDEPVVGPVRVSAPAVFTGTGDLNDHDENAGALTTLVVYSNSDLNGTNTIYGTNGNDVIDAKGGDDTIYGYDGTDNLVGGAGSDTIYGGAGVDTIGGGSETDYIYGGSGGDAITGGAFKDIIYGGSGDDLINGDAGDDEIYGGYGADTLAGGDGADAFKFLTLNDTGDTINGFIQGADKLDFSAIDANTSTSPTNEAFSFTTSSTMALSANGINWFHESGNTVVQFDNNGDTSNAEFEITLTGEITLTATDFVL